MLDGLTGLGDHRAYRDELERQTASYARHRVPFALLLIDIDGMRAVNDGAGHHVGDQLLSTVAVAIETVARFADRAFRVGGDEFALLLPHTDQTGALEIAKRLRARLQAAGTSQELSFSAGISSCPTMAVVGRDLAAQAELALARARRRGRGSVEVFDPRRDELQSDAEAAAEAVAVATVARERQLRAVFQPIVDLASGEVLGFEGLIRPTEEAPFANPGALFKAAEAAGRTIELDAACFEVVTRAATTTDPRKVVSINLSPRTIEAADFDAAAVVASMVGLGFQPGRLIIELTEREVVQDMPRLRRNLTELQQAGIRIAADDVGAGNAGPAAAGAIPLRHRQDRPVAGPGWCRARFVARGAAVAARPCGTPGSLRHRRGHRDGRAAARGPGAGPVGRARLPAGSALAECRPPGGRPGRA